MILDRSKKERKRSDGTQRTKKAGKTSKKLLKTTRNWTKPGEAKMYKKNGIDGWS